MFRGNDEDEGREEKNVNDENEWTSLKTEMFGGNEREQIFKLDDLERLKKKKISEDSNFCITKESDPRQRCL